MGSDNYNQRIKNNLVYILQHTSNVPRLLSLLLRDGIIESSQKTQVESLQTYDEQVETLFLKLATKGATNELEISKILRQTGNAHVVDKIEGKATLKSIKSVAALQVYMDYKNKNSPKLPVRKTFFIMQEGEPDKFEKFENVAAEIGKELEVLSLKYVQVAPKQLLKAFDCCENLNVIKLHNVKISGLFSKKVELKSLLEFSYFDDHDINDIEHMPIEERLRFLQELLFFVQRNQLLKMECLQVKITICIANHNYVKVCESENKNPFQLFSKRRESISVIEEAFAEIGDE